MVAGIAAPGPSGIPGFNEFYLVRAGAGGGVANAVPLRSWYNVVINVATAGDSVMLPPAAANLTVMVLNNSGQVSLFPGSVGNSCNVFGNNQSLPGQQDTIASAAGVQGTAGVAVPVNAVGLFFCILPQSGFSNEPNPGAWQYKILT